MAAAVEAPDSLLAAVRAGSVRLGPERVRRALLARLAPEKRDRLMELGVGSGSSLFAVAARVTDGFVAGVEPDSLALRHAARRCARLVREGRVTLVAGSSADLSVFAPASFGKVYGVHVSSFWDEPVEHVTEIRRVLRPGGRLLLGESLTRAGGEPRKERLEAALREAGFQTVHIERADPLLWITAH